MSNDKTSLPQKGLESQTPELPKDIETGFSLEIIRDEINRSLIRKVVDAPPPESFFEKWSKNPLVVVVLGFVLTGVVGAVLTNHYNTRLKEIEFERAERQAELERKRSFLVEFNKKKVEKISEVWEKVSMAEAAQRTQIERFQGYFQYQWEQHAKKYNIDINVAPRGITGVNENFSEWLMSEPMNERLARDKELEETLTKNRFWLGERYYSDIKEFYGLIDEYNDRQIKELFRHSGYGDENRVKIKELAEAIERSRADLIRVREDLLKEQ